MDFEAYLISKRIDSALFRKSEPDVWQAWKEEFEQIHPTSFTAQKLYMINPVRRKYLLKTPEKAKPENIAPDGQNSPSESVQSATPTNPKPSVPRPVFKPKPKLS